MHEPVIAGWRESSSGFFFFASFFFSLSSASSSGNGFIYEYIRSMVEELVLEDMVDVALPDVS